MSLQIQLKKSAVSQKQPFASDLAIGELALNYNANGPFLTCKDSAGNVRKLNNVWVATAAPNNPSAGDLWLDTSAATAVLKVYKDSTSTWVNATTIPVATTSIFGSVQLASAADITNGTAGKVVDAAQLQSKISAELSANPITFQGVNVVNNVTIGGDLTVNGTQTIINTTTLDVEDKNIVIGNVATPSNTTADGGGISLLGATTKTLNWVNATGAWTSSERFSVPVGSAAAPSLTFTGDPDTGIYNSAANQVSISTAGTERLRIDPNGQLHAVSLGAAATPTFSFTTDTNTGIYSPGADQLAISTGGSGRLFVDGSGNVSIKGSSTNGVLSIEGTSSAQIHFRESGSGTKFIYTTASDIEYRNNSVGSQIWYTSSSERLRITSAGLVGIGTSAPADVLHINGGQIRIQKDVPQLLFRSADGSSNQYYIGANISDTVDGGFVIGEGPGITGGTPRIAITGTGNVGIGTAGPSENLSIGGGANLYATLTSTGGIKTALAAADANGFGWAGTTTNHAFALFTNNAERLRITSAGLVGIGTSAPGYALTVGSASPTFDRVAQFNSNTANSFLGFGTTGGTGEFAAEIGAAGSDAVINTQNTERLRVTAAGNVGIGTTSPSVPLVVSAATSPQIQLIRPTGVDLRLNAQFANTDLASLSVVSNHPLAFHTNNTERARFDSVGRFLIGTSTAVGSSTGVQGFLQHQSSDTGTAANANFGRWTNDTGGYALYFAKSRGTSVGTQGLLSDGDFLGALFFEGSDGTQLRRAASITANVDGTPGTNSMPGRIVLSTTASGASSPTERLRITSAGLVGIGTSNATGKLGIAVSGTRSLGAVWDDKSVLIGNPAQFGANLGLSFDTTNGATIESAAPGSSFYPVRVVGSEIQLFTSTSERLRIDSSGRLLVGTSTSVNYGAEPKVQIVDSGIGLSIQRPNNEGIIVLGNSGVVSSASNLSLLSFTGYDGTNYLSAASIRAQVDGTPGTNSMPGRIVLSTTASGASSPTERMRITNGGNINIGTGGGEVDAVSGTTDGATFYGAAGVQISRNGANVLTLRRRTSDGNIVAFTRDTTLVGSISVTTTATAYNTSSDYRLKENVVAVTDGITRLQQLKPSRFNFIADPTKTVDGFLAHEAAEVVPECVTGEKDAVNDDGNPVYQGIDQSKLVPLLTAALQEAIAKIESLEARLTAAGI